MKIKFILLVLCIGYLYSSCDKINPPYREQVVVLDFCTTGIQDSVAHKKVLVEDYTGHLCGNCPDAGIFLNDTLKSIYNHCLVVVSVHAGYFAGTCPTAFACPHYQGQPADAFITDFNTPVGTTWNNFFGITGNPKGMVDRIDYPTLTHSKSVNAWAPAIASELAKAAQAKINITNTYSSASNSVNINVVSDFVTNISADLKLSVVITEDSIVDWQEWYNHTPEYVSDFVFHHVLRGAVNTDWGESIVTGGASNGTTITKNYNYTINNSWNVDHCSIVAFIYDAATYEVLQVEEAPVK